MRWVTILGVAAVLFLMAPFARGSEGIADVIRLQEAGSGQDVLMAFVQSSSVAYSPTADEIAKLEQAGVPAAVVVAMIDHGRELRMAAAPAMPGQNAEVASNQLPAAEGLDAPVTVPPPDKMNISFFYSALAPYGAWYDVPPYGWVWRPGNVAADESWRPYCDGGQWLDTNCGWYFHSGYPWGWAAFHYGRWLRHPSYHWVWIPDTTWGPAWVEWRKSDTCYAWAPLPPDAIFGAGVGFSFHGKHAGFGFDLDFGLTEPDFCCVPCDSFLAVDLGHVRFGRDRVADLFRHTRAVRNAYVFHEDRIINEGLPVSEISERTHRKIERLEIADAGVKAGEAVPFARIVNRKIEAFRPTVADTAPLDPVAVMERRYSSRLLRTTETGHERLIEEQQRLDAEKALTNREARVERKAVLSEEEARRRLTDEKTRLRTIQDERSDLPQRGDIRSVEERGALMGQERKPALRREEEGRSSKDLERSEGRGHSGGKHDRD